MCPNNEDRLERIETLLAHQEKQIEELSEMTAEQWSEIARLKRKLDMTQQQLSEMSHSAKDGKSETGLTTTEIAALNKPPHY